MNASMVMSRAGHDGNWEDEKTKQIGNLFCPEYARSEGKKYINGDEHGIHSVLYIFCGVGIVALEQQLQQKLQHQWRRNNKTSINSSSTDDGNGCCFSPQPNSIQMRSKWFEIFTNKSILISFTVIHPFC